MIAVELFLRGFRLRGSTSSKKQFFQRMHSFTAIWFWDFAWIWETKILKYCSSFRANLWLHISSITSILPHIVIDWVVYKYKADSLSWYSDANKYQWIEEVNKFLPRNFNIFPFFKRCFCVRYLEKFRFYK